MRIESKSWLRALAATAESPQVKLDRRRHDRLDRDTPRIEQLMPGRTARGRGPQHGMGREEGGEHHDVAEQKNPKAVSHDDALGSWAAFTVAGRIVAPGAAIVGTAPTTVVAELIRIDRRCGS